ncbi:hypothetical protein ACFYNO_37755 [Kitasatospora sp. NPDC006697]|uniref:hypothetical protein n=1 Tax=Kitasatospora sp. NPDC006697 TaxID=3364020 RepID=UPI0036C1E4C9
MADRGADGPARRWRGSRAARALIVLAGLPLVVLGFLLFTGGYEERGGYRTAPLCGTPAPGPDADCLLRESGRVTGKQVTDSAEDGVAYYLDVARGTGSARKFEVDEYLYRHVETGSTVDLTVWQNMVVRIAQGGHEVGTTDLSWHLWFGLAAATAAIAAGTVVTAFGLPGRNPAFRHSAPLLFLGTAMATAIGAVILVLVQWPFPVTLGLAAAAWLAAVPTVRYLHSSFA